MKAVKKFLFIKNKNHDLDTTTPASPMKHAPVKQPVFINCPFDEDYQPLFKAMIFCVTFLDHYQPTFSESISSSEFRLKIITKLIREAKLCIHDLSRNTSTKEGEKARFNMPFELGLDMGSILVWRQKVFS
jgi:hypothetical protein